MSVKKGASIYYHHDKAIFDGLSQHNVSKNKIKEMLLEKGVFVSDSDEKEDHVKYLSSYIFDYHDKSVLSQILQVIPRREHTKSMRISSPDVNSKITNESIRQALVKVKELYSNDSDVEARVVANQSGSFIEMQYKSYDLTKPEMKQVEQKKATIEVFLDGGEVTVRSPANDFSNSVVESFRGYVSEEIGVSLEKDEINLSGLTPNSVTDFFKNLINSIDGYKLNDVSNVKLYHPSEDSEDSEDSEVGVDVITLSNIKRAILQGEKVMISPELKSLFDRGFYISYIQWTSDEDTTSSGDRVSFEASLKDPENKTDFTYQVRGVQRYSDRTGNITSKITVPSNIEKRKLHSLLEKSAKAAFSNVSVSLEGDDE